MWLFAVMLSSDSWEPLSPYRCVLAVILPTMIVRWGLRRNSLSRSGARAGSSSRFFCLILQECSFAFRLFGRYLNINVHVVFFQRLSLGSLWHWVATGSWSPWWHSSPSDQRSLGGGPIERGNLKPTSRKVVRHLKYLPVYYWIITTAHCFMVDDFQLLISSYE